MTEQEELRMLRERLGPRGLEVVIINGGGHYVNAFVKAEVERLRGLITVACDFLAERRYGSPARSPGHNARLVLEDALADAPAVTNGDDQ